MYFKELEFTSQPALDWVAPYAAKAAHALESLSFPTKKDEDWRFTPLKTLSKHAFQSVNGEAKSVTEEHVQKYRLPESKESTLVLVNGVIREDLSTFSLSTEAITVKKLQDMTPSELDEAGFQSLVPVERDYFSVLHTATLTSGYYLHVHKGAKVEAPIHVLNIQTGSATPYVSSFRLLIHVEQEAEATLIEEHVSLDDSVYLTIPVMETFVQKKGRLNHLRIQRENKSCFHVSRPITSLEGTAEYHSYTISLGAHLFRNEPQIIQTGEEVDFTLDGLILIDGDQISDTHSVMDHRFSHGNSHQLHKVVVHGNAHSVFNGKIFVRQDAQIIDSFQENRNLLLSRDGIVYTKPQLEIFADDVQCSHGATIGDLDPDEVFYLQSRGMTEQKAKEVLTYAFALETIENIEVESVHTFLVDEVKAYTSRNVASRF
tara:strand:+ start:948 stop:2240 length:1293 start_codon:yes stop_codon:yes gene_type:complete